jgi:hypothetical protein
MAGKRRAKMTRHEAALADLVWVKVNPAYTAEDALAFMRKVRLGELEAGSTPTKGDVR